ncbi:MAG TPA: hypothetical protein VF559_00695 [Caulobacteraceae bacterium]
MVSKTDVLTEALVAAIAAAVVTIVLDRLQVAPRVSRRLRPGDERLSEIQEDVAEKPLWPARLLEAGVAMLLFRTAAGASRPAIHGALKAAGAMPTSAMAKSAMSSRSLAPSIH